MVQRDVRRLVAAVAVALALTACGGSSGSGDDTSAGSTAPSTTEKENAKRPEGRWTLVSTQLERSDVEDLDPGLSGVRLSLFEPSCPSGPCDIGAAPAGEDGT